MIMYVCMPGAPDGDNDSFHESMWEEERRQRQMIHFEFGDDSDVDVRQLWNYFSSKSSKMTLIYVPCNDL